MVYFKLNYYLGIKDFEADEMDGTRVDAYMIILAEMNKEGGSGGKRENDELMKQFMG